MYLTDQAGSYEVVAAKDVSRGHVLRQMVPRRPVSFCTEAPTTYSVIGDFNWTAVRVGVDVLIEDEGTAFLGTAVTTGGCVFGVGSPAIVFAISSTGMWLVSNDTDLKTPAVQGKAAIHNGTWYHLELDVTAAGTVVWLDGNQLATVPQLSSKDRHGWVRTG